jgi:hypothetical protein
VQIALAVSWGFARFVVRDSLRVQLISA